VPIFAALRPILEAHRDKHAKDVRPDGLVFATARGGPFDPGDVAKRATKAWAGKAGVYASRGASRRGVGLD